MREPRHPVPSLLATLAAVPDPRQPRGVRHPLPALLGLACTAALCGYTTPTEIADFGRNHAADLHDALGFTHPTMPCDGTFHYLFDDFDVAAFERLVGQWVEQVNSAYAPPGQEALALDGKTLRGSKRQGVPAVHLLAALSQALQLPLQQQAMPLTTNEATAAIAFLRGLPLDERLVTMDAAFTHREVCQTILDGGGDYLCCVKENQPTLLEDIQRAFSPLSPPGAPATSGRADD